jgi:membrane-bound lytic murein transglycosylase B
MLRQLDQHDHDQPGKFRGVPRFRKIALAAVISLAAGLSSGCGSATPTATTASHAEERERAANPVAQAEETAAKEYMDNRISEAQYHEHLKAIEAAGEEGVCAKDAKLFPNSCNADGTVKH